MSRFVQLKPVLITFFIFLILICFIFSFYINSLNSQINILQSELNKISNDKIGLESEIEIFKTQIHLLDEEKNALESLIKNYEANLTSVEYEKTSFKSQVETLENQKSLLLYQIENLEFQINLIEKDKLTLESQMSILQSNMSARARITELNSQIITIQKDFDDYIKNYQNLRALINGRAFHPNSTSFITPQDFEVKSLVNTITGGWSNTLDYNEFLADISKLYNWVLTNIEYRYDGLSPKLPITPRNSIDYLENMWQFANETINLKKGDCEDQAILLCSMIKCYNNELINTYCICLSSSTANHLGVQIQCNKNTLAIFDPVGDYCTKNPYGLIVYKDINTEINNWLDYCKPSLGSDVYVYRIFCEDFEFNFKSTNEYVMWIENNQ